MTERWAVANGNWSNPAIWNGGTLPGVDDTVHAGGFTQVLIDVDVTVQALSTRAGAAAPAGGQFKTNGQRIINADVYAGTATCLSLEADSGSVLNGDTYGSDTTSARYGVFVRATCVQHGNSFGASGAATGGAGTQVQIGGRQYGTATGGANSFSYGTAMAGGWHIGDSFGGSGQDAIGVNHIGTNGGIRIGNSYGGSGLGAHGTSAPFSFMLLFGACHGGSVAGAHGAFLATGCVGIISLATGDTADAFGVRTTSASNVVIIEQETGAFAKDLVAGTDTTYALIPFAVDRFGPVPGDVRSGIQYGTLDAFTGTLASPTVPIEADVRLGVLYGVDEQLTGAAAIPAPQSVLFGVPVDATTGLATLDATSIAAAVWNAPRSEHIEEGSFGATTGGNLNFALVAG